MVVPLGLVMVIGLVATVLLTTGSVVVQKCAVQPESAMTSGEPDESLDEGGPELETGAHNIGNL